jgi:hypothetical protein
LGLNDSADPERDNDGAQNKCAEFQKIITSASPFVSVLLNGKTMFIGGVKYTSEDGVCWKKQKLPISSKEIKDFKPLLQYYP